MKIRYLGVICSIFTIAHAGNNDFPYAYLNSHGKMEYKPFSSKGDMIPDYSYCGYKGGGVKLPELQNKIEVSPDADDLDDRERIQAAIDKVSQMPMDENGFRGAVLLKKGKFELNFAPGKNWSLNVNASGVVLHGQGKSSNGTILHSIARKPGKLIVTSNGRKSIRPGRNSKIVDEYLPVNFRTITVKDSSMFKVGDEIGVRRRTNLKWVKAINADKISRMVNINTVKKDPNKLDRLGRKKYFQKKYRGKMVWYMRMPWRPGLRETYWRVIKKIEANKITIDVPVPEYFSQEYGGGIVYKLKTKTLENIGFENFYISTVWEKGSNGADTRQHISGGIEFHNLQNSWAFDIAGSNLSGYLINVMHGNRFVTIQDCYLNGQTAEIMNFRVTGYYGGGAFCINGEQILVQRCFTENVRHFGYTVGGGIAGPNVFLDCSGRYSGGCAETHHRWSPGVLWDRMGHVSPTNIGIFDRGGCGSGHGWTTNNSIIWNSVGLRTLQAQSPPVGHNFCVGGIVYNKKNPYPGDKKSYYNNGYFVAPRSLYLQQLKERLGEQAIKNIAMEWQIKGRVVTPLVQFFQRDAMITMTALEPKSQIRYTLDGTNPDKNSTLYIEAFEFSQGGIIKAAAFKKGLLPSAVAVEKIVPSPFVMNRGKWISQKAIFKASSRRPRDMKLLNGQDGKARYTFYTGTQRTPWIIIDLKSEFEIKGISIAYRQDRRWLKRTKGLTVELSDDKKTWRKIWTAAKEALSWEFLLKKTQNGRYVRISLPGNKRQLCLKNVKIYGTK